METALLDGVQQQLQQGFFSFLAKPISQLRQQLGADYEQQAEAFLQLLNQAVKPEQFTTWAAESFASFNREILRDEIQFKQTGEYSRDQSDYQDICQQFYASEEIMAGYYLPGLYLSYVFWPHHFQLLNFFQQQFLDDAQVNSIMEWGIGHGLFSYLAMQHWPDSHLTAFDISQHSIDFSKQLLSHHGGKVAVDYRIDDVLQAPLPKVDRIICCELLEHVPEPGRLLTNIHQQLLDNGKALITGAINSAQPDHIVLFTSEEEVMQLVEQAGLTIEASQAFIHPSRQDQAIKPTVLAMVVSK